MSYSIFRSFLWWETLLTKCFKLWKLFPLVIFFQENFSCPGKLQKGTLSNNENNLSYWYVLFREVNISTDFVMTENAMIFFATYSTSPVLLLITPDNCPANRVQLSEETDKQTSVVKFYSDTSILLGYQVLWRRLCELFYPCHKIQVGTVLQFIWSLMTCEMYNKIDVKVALNVWTHSTSVFGMRAGYVKHPLFPNLITFLLLLKKGLLFSWDLSQIQ